MPQLWIRVLAVAFDRDSRTACQNDTPVLGPLDDLALVDATTGPRPSRFSAEIGPDLERVFDEQLPAWDI